MWHGGNTYEGMDGDYRFDDQNILRDKDGDEVRLRPRSPSKAPPQVPPLPAPTPGFRDAPLLLPSDDDAPLVQSPAPKKTKKAKKAKKAKKEVAAQEEEALYIVEEIKKEWLNEDDGEMRFLVSWRGYTSDDDTWEPASNLGNCDIAMAAFREKVLAKRETKAKAKAAKRSAKAAPHGGTGGRHGSADTGKQARRASSSSSTGSAPAQQAKDARKTAEDLCVCDKCTKRARADDAVGRSDIGRRVEATGYGPGVLAFFGSHREKIHNRCGVKLDAPTGRNNGTVGGNV